MTKRTQPTQQTDSARQTLLEVGCRVAELRNGLGWTQEHLAERLDCSVDRIQRIERGSNLTLRSLIALAATLGTVPSALFEAPANADRRVGRPPRRSVPGDVGR
jgi:transcriptional regulator with XRE-family HTH domain